VRKPEGKRPLGRPRNRKQDNIKMDLQEVGLGGGGGGGRAWTGFTCLRIGTVGRHL
jgi:hypothetical protein